MQLLPLPSRQPMTLALLMPGTNADAVRPRKANANIGAGAFTMGSALLVDGVWNKEGNTGEPRQDFPQAAIREFKVYVSQSPAEYGWTAGGVVSFALGSVFLFRGDVPGFRLSWPVVATATIASAGFLVIALAAVWRAHRRAVVTGEAALLRSAGRVLRWDDGEGEILVMGERWAAKSNREFAPGDRVRILERQDLKLIVAPDPDRPPNPEE